MKPPWATDIKMPFVYRLMNFLLWLFLRVLYRFRVYGQEQQYKGAAIIAANHVSYLDPPILGVAWPEEVHYLAKDSLFNIPVLGSLITKLNTHPLKGDVGDVAVFKLIVKLLREGKKVILFPEGQRSFDDIMTPIKPGISLLAFKTDAAIIPAYIFGTFEAWPRKRKFPKFFKEIGCVFGSPLIWKNVEHLDRKEAQIVFAAQIKAAIEELKKWYEAGAHGTPP